ncbi:MAG TPA: glycosyltransferase family 2 protein, partial [Chroococcidiopsis sp.]
PAHKLQHQLQVLRDRPEVDIVNGYVQLLQAVEPQSNGTDQPMRQFEQRFAPMVSFNLGSALFRRSVFDRVGYFDAQRIHSEDVDWFMRARELGVGMVVLEEVTLLYRKHDSNLTRDRQENMRGFLDALRKSIHRRQHTQETPGAPVALPQLTYINTAGELHQKDSHLPAVLTQARTAETPIPKPAEGDAEESPSHPLSPKEA